MISADLESVWLILVLVMFRPFIADLESAVYQLRPSVLVGVAAQPGAFTPKILQLMGQINR